jgi:hypothetical protein
MQPTYFLCVNLSPGFKSPSLTPMPRNSLTLIPPTVTIHVNQFSVTIDRLQVDFIESREGCLLRLGSAPVVHPYRAGDFGHRNRGVLVDSVPVRVAQFQRVGFRRGRLLCLLHPAIETIDQ